MNTKETRAKANNEVDRKHRYFQIVEILEESKVPLSAKEISVEMYKRGYSVTSERNLSHPRLNELVDKGIVETANAKICKYTGKTVMTYKLKERGN